MHIPKRSIGRAGVTVPCRLFGGILILLLATAAQSAVAQDLSARLADPADWNGKVVPAHAICRLAGATSPMSPRIIVEGIPKDATEIVVEFNDESYPRLAENGGHGSIAIKLKPTDRSATVPSVPSESDTVPDGVTVVKKHRSTTPGYYLAPCSRGQKHVYAASVIVNGKSLLRTVELARVRLVLGVY